MAARLRAARAGECPDGLLTGRRWSVRDRPIGDLRGLEAPFEPNRSLFEGDAVEGAKTRTVLVLVRKRELDLINHARQEPAAVRRRERHHPLEDIVIGCEKDPVVGGAAEDRNGVPVDGLRQKVAIEPQFDGAIGGDAAGVRWIGAAVFASAVRRIDGDDVQRRAGGGLVLRSPEVATRKREGGDDRYSCENTECEPRDRAG